MGTCSYVARGFNRPALYNNTYEVHIYVLNKEMSPLLRLCPALIGCLSVRLSYYFIHRFTAPSKTRVLVGNKQRNNTGVESESSSLLHHLLRGNHSMDELCMVERAPRWSPKVRSRLFSCMCDLQQILNDIFGGGGDGFFFCYLGLPGATLQFALSAYRVARSIGMCASVCEIAVLIYLRRLSRLCSYVSVARLRVFCGWLPTYVGYR